MSGHGLRPCVIVHYHEISLKRGNRPLFLRRLQENLARAVGDLGWVRLKGYVAWWFWLLAQLFFLIGFLSVLMGLTAEVTMRTYHNSDTPVRVQTRSMIEGDQGRGLPGPGSPEGAVGDAWYVTQIVTVDENRLYRLVAAVDGVVRELGKSATGSFVRRGVERLTEDNLLVGTPGQEGKQAGAGKELGEKFKSLGHQLS